MFDQLYNKYIPPYGRPLSSIIRPNQNTPPDSRKPTMTDIQNILQRLSNQEDTLKELRSEMASKDRMTKALQEQIHSHAQYIERLKKDNATSIFNMNETILQINARLESKVHDQERDMDETKATMEAQVKEIAVLRAASSPKSPSSTPAKPAVTEPSTTSQAADIAQVSASSPIAGIDHSLESATRPRKLLYCDHCFESVNTKTEKERKTHAAGHDDLNSVEFVLLTVQEARKLRADLKASQPETSITTRKRSREQVKDDANDDNMSGSSKRHKLSENQDDATQENPNTSSNPRKAVAARSSRKPRAKGKRHGGSLNIPSTMNAMAVAGPSHNTQVTSMKQEGRDAVGGSTAPKRTRGAGSEGGAEDDENDGDSRKSLRRRQ